MMDSQVPAERGPRRDAVKERMWRRHVRRQAKGRRSVDITQRRAHAREKRSLRLLDVFGGNALVQRRLLIDRRLDIRESQRLIQRKRIQILIILSHQ